MTDSNATELHWKTKRFRALLEERGEPYIASEDDMTIFFDDENGRYTFNVNPETGWTQLFGYHLTPEQAVAATLWRGECEIEWRNNAGGGFTVHCGNCGADLDCDTRNSPQSYCPRCGWKVRR